MEPVQFPFREVQRFRQWWIWPLIIGVALVPVFLTWFLVFAEDAPRPVMIFPVVFAALFSMLPIILLYTFRLETVITKEAISYRFFPLHKKTRTIEWKELQSVYVRKYSPMFEYGGWGVRVSLRNGIALNVSGNKGIQLVFKNGKRILVGTQCPEEVEKLLASLEDGTFGQQDFKTSG